MTAYKPETLVKTYEGRKAPGVTAKFQEDMQKMAAQGYRVSSQSVIPQRAGCLKRIFTLGLGAGKTTMTVTYEMTPEEKERQRAQMMSPQ